MLELGTTALIPKQDIESPSWSRFITILGRLGELVFATSYNDPNAAFLIRAQHNPFYSSCRILAVLFGLAA